MVVNYEWNSHQIKYEVVNYEWNSHQIKYELVNMVVTIQIWYRWIKEKENSPTKKDSLETKKITTYIIFILLTKTS